MSDRESIKSMLERASVAYEESDHEITVSADDGNPALGHDGGPNRGYPGFYSVFTFGDAGQLVAMGAWE